MSSENWLEKFRKNPQFAEELGKKAKAASGAQRDQLPNLMLPIDLPMLVRTLEKSRIIPRTAYGPREVIDVEIMETTDPAQEEGMRCTMWLTQSAFRGQMEKFRDESAGVVNLAGETIVAIPEGLELFILNHGKVKSETSRYSYYNYTILTLEEGRKLIAEL